MASHAGGDGADRAFQSGGAGDVLAVVEGQVLEDGGGSQAGGQGDALAVHQGQPVGEGVQQALVHRQLHLAVQRLARQIVDLPVKEGLGDGVQRVGQALGQVDVPLHLQVFQVAQGFGAVLGQAQVPQHHQAVPQTAQGRAVQGQVSPSRALSTAISRLAAQ